MVILGILILLFVMTDVVVTTLTLGGGGPLTDKVAMGLWRIVLYYHRRSSNHKLLFLAGPIILLTTALLWFTLIFIAWILIFNASEIAVVTSSNKVPASFWERVYFVGYTLSTLGMGDFQPQGVAWQLATAIASVNGFVLVSLSITYLLPVISAATQKRQLAVYISSLGGATDEIVARAWNGKDFGQFGQHLITIAPQITLQSEQHLTYPVLHYFHSIERSRAFVLSLAALDEALTLLQYGVKESARPDPAALSPIRRTIAAFLRTLSSTYIEPADVTPPPPPLELLRANGIPTVSDQEFWENLELTVERRKLLLALVQEDGWTWDSIASTKTTSRATNLDDYAVTDDVILR
ncbi:MAG: potassium channel family protein [Elainellaceae cyanobacterium]